MGFGKLNIWIREEDCRLINAWRADLEVKTCLGENLIDILSDRDLEKIVDDLKEMYPEAAVSVGYRPWYETKTIRIEGKAVINHIHVQVPPGCYVVRVHECGEGNEWSDRIMVVVGCGDELCLNLIVKRAESCAAELIIPLLKIAEEIHLPKDQVQVAIDILRKAGRVPIKNIVENLQARANELKDIEDARDVVNKAKIGLKTIRDLQLEARKKR
jgi:hypothetical protein